MGNQQTHRHRNRITPLQQDNIASTTSNIIPLDSENSFIIWLEIPLKNRTNHGESVELRHRLRQVFPHIQSFCDFQTCINHIKNARLNCDQRFILIFSGLIARSRVMSFYNIPSVALIYFCVYSENDLFYNWINCNNNKIRGLFNNIDSLYNQLINDVRVDNYKVFLSLPITVFSNDGAETSTRTINADYLWLQLLIEMIINMNHTEQAKEQMFKLCFLHYQNDANGLKALEKFRSTYMSDQAICWYTADSFMYRLLNKALRYPENFDNVFKFRYFIADLHRQLKTIHHNFSAKIVYRGQMISAQELNMFKENCGKCISVNTFLSTTFDEEVAKLYAGNGQQRPKLESVLFVIHINDTIPNNKPFASIKDYTKINCRYKYLENRIEIDKYRKSTCRQIDESFFG
ncbi:unnamed protein product [Rotaria sordida]|uniref:NAD(P)(+)--arginine ADP-ribosyltransferase n=1 Tax=Rotaria sordida TaxID=392033 RepID=A0A814V5V3_9BILA|nr:unnamed protein product [Rotaria sordida]CAF1091718.1 unnamed protein product [Rotaria sordida]CAF1182375.1 unnamed protein product [Rotaria sordida]CAF1241969.1 unnamed protein product [Rotaria sordida]CAF1443996.1 unnamed protein product [Rotaria sordida]